MNAGLLALAAMAGVGANAPTVTNGLTVPPPVVVIPSPPRPPAAELFHRAVPPRPLMPLPFLFNSGDYPAQAMRDRSEGRVVTALTIDPSGRIASCSIEVSSRSTALDLATCSILRRRARFEPARDAQGAAVDGAVRVPIQWKLPHLPRIPLTAWQSMVTLIVGPAGQLRRCTETLVAVALAPGPGCRSIATAPDSSRVRLRGADDKGDATIVFDTRLRPEGALPANPAARGRGDTILGLLSAKLMIDASGDLVGCEIIERHGNLLGPPTTPCERNFKGPYAASGIAGPRIAHTVVTIYRRQSRQ